VEKLVAEPTVKKPDKPRSSKPKPKSGWAF